MRNANFLAFLFLLLTQLSLANDASFIGDGATVYTNKESRVRMSKETIIITYDRGATKDRVPWKADCTFEFENISNEPITLTMGFPNWKGFGDNVDMNAYVIKHFTTRINDKPVESTLKDISIKNQVGPWVKKANSLETFDGAYVWPVQIPAKEKIVVKNTFSFGGFLSNGPFNVLEKMPTTYPKIKKDYLFWRAKKLGKKDIDFANALVGAAAYITTTGQTWSGPIGEATITFDLPYELNKTPHFVLPLPRGYHLQKNKVTWHFKNYSPKEEIALYFLSHVFVPDELPENTPLGFQYPEQAKAWLKFSSKSRIDPEVVDQLIAISPNPKVKRVLLNAKDKLANTKLVE